jgi:hypothetical protein
MPKEENTERIMFEADAQHYAPVKKLMDDKGFNLKEAMYYIIDGKIEETCACEGCDWYDGFDSKRDLPRCLNRTPPIDKRFLSRTSGEICRKMREDQRQLEAMQRRTILTPLFIKLFREKNATPITFEHATNIFKTLLCRDAKNLKDWEAIVAKALII